MPLGKYYCDYCDKEFQDSALARSRHLRSSSHLRAKSLWYNSLNHYFSSSQANPTNAFVKGLCNRFVKTGFCPYGNSCKYLHATATQGSWGNNVGSPIVPGNQLVGGSSLAGQVERYGMGMPWGNLPPSLMPPPEGGYTPVTFVDWG